MLQTAKQALLASADKEAKGIQGVFARPADGGGGFLINNIKDIPFNVNPLVGMLITNSSITHGVLENTLNNVVPLLQQAAVGSVALYVPIYEPATPGYASSAGGKSAIRRNGGKTRRVFLLGHQGGTEAEPSLTGRIAQVTINLAAWIAHPPADLKMFAPTYTLENGGFIDFTKTTYPDPTFGGLFPNGLPNDLLL